MRYEITVVLILVALGSITNKSQTLKLGLRIEPTILFTEQNNSSSLAITPWAIYGSAILEPIEGYGFEVRPGYFIGSEYYGGFEIGCFLRWSIFSSKYFLVGGINNHSNTWLGSHNGGSGISKSMLYKGIGIGYQKDSKLSFDLMYYWTDDKEYAYSRDTDWLTYSRTIYKKMNGILKFGFNLSFTIL